MHIESHASLYLLSGKRKSQFIQSKEFFIVAFVCFVFNNKHLRYLSLFAKRIVIISFIKSVEDIFTHQEKQPTSYEVEFGEVLGWVGSSRVRCI